MTPHALETYRSLIQISLAVLKLMALLNGGAAVALLAYLGNIAGKDVTAPDLRFSMGSFLAGRVFCGLAFLASYLTQFWLYNEEVRPGALRGPHQLWLALGVAFAFFEPGRLRRRRIQRHDAATPRQDAAGRHGYHGSGGSSRRAGLVAGLGFLQLPPRAPELRLPLHPSLDTRTGLGPVVVGVERQGLRFSMSHIAEGEWRATFMAHPMFAPAGFGVAATPPWVAVAVKDQRVCRRTTTQP
jgi:hypothetical protein